MKKMSPPKKIAVSVDLTASTGCFEHDPSPTEPRIAEIHRFPLEALDISYRFKPQRDPHFEREKRCFDEATSHRALNGDVVCCEFDDLSFHGKRSSTTAGVATDSPSVDPFYSTANLFLITKQNRHSADVFFTV